MALRAFALVFVLDVCCLNSCRDADTRYGLSVTFYYDHATLFELCVFGHPPRESKGSMDHKLLSMEACTFRIGCCEDRFMIPMVDVFASYFCLISFFILFYC